MQRRAPRAWPVRSDVGGPWGSSSVCDAAVVVLAAVTAWAPRSQASLPWLAMLLGAVLGAAGVWLSASGVDWRRRLGWELQACAVALVAVGWFALQ